MGETITVVCRKCRRRFAVHHGGGMLFHLLHCDRCGQEATVTHSQMGDTHLAYLRRVGGTYAVHTADETGATGDARLGEPLGEEQYDRAVEEIAGACACGGHFRLTAPARCPQCGSAALDRDDRGPISVYG